MTVAPAAGNGFGGGGGVSGAGRKDVHPGMLESEFLAATGEANAARVDGGGGGGGGGGGAEGAVLASLSLEEVPYDRDLRCACLPFGMGYEASLLYVRGKKRFRTDGTTEAFVVCPPLIALVSI